MNCFFSGTLLCEFTKFISNYRLNFHTLANYLKIVNMLLCVIECQNWAL